VFGSRRRTVSPAPPLEQHVVREDHGGTAVGVKDGVDVLDEVQLLVGGVGPEVLTGDKHLLALGAAVGGHDERGGFSSERRVRQAH
jgi:hypothetical protein